MSDNNGTYPIYLALLCSHGHTSNAPQKQSLIHLSKAKRVNYGINDRGPLHVFTWYTFLDAHILRANIIH